MHNNKDIKIVFLGTPNFGADILKYLSKKFNVVAAITAPDKKIHSCLKESQVKKVAKKENILVMQPKKIKNNKKFYKKITKIKTDFLVVASYGFIIPQKILESPEIAPLNIHPSLLPKYRGACPIRAAIKNGEKKTGVTIMKMDEKLDHGPILNQEKCNIDPHDNYISLKNKLIKISKRLIVKTIKQYQQNKIRPKPQDHSKATYTEKICKKDGKIDWNKSAQKIKDLIQAYCQKPGTYSKIHLPGNKLHKKRLKIFKVDKVKKQGVPGNVFTTKSNNIGVHCQKNSLILKQIQLPGKNIISGKDLYNGYNQIKNAKLV